MRKAWRSCVVSPCPDLPLKLVSFDVVKLHAWTVVNEKNKRKKLERIRSRLAQQHVLKLSASQQTESSPDLDVRRSSVPHSNHAVEQIFSSPRLDKRPGTDIHERSGEHRLSHSPFIRMRSIFRRVPSSVYEVDAGRIDHLLTCRRQQSSSR